MKDQRSQFILYGLILLAGVIATLALTISADTGISPEKSGTTLIHSGYYALPSSQEATRRADLIVIAQVEEPLDAFWTTSSGLRPELSDRELVLTPEFRIFTPQVLKIERVLKGTSSGQDKLVLNHLGGTVGDDRVVVEDSPLSLTEGKTVLAFLKDCGTERAESLGSPGFRYVLVSKYIVDGGNIASAQVPVPMDEMLRTIEDSKGEQPRSQTSC